MNQRRTCIIDFKGLILGFRLNTRETLRKRAYGDSGASTRLCGGIGMISTNERIFFLMTIIKKLLRLLEQKGLLSEEDLTQLRAEVESVVLGKQNWEE